MSLQEPKLSMAHVLHAFPSADTFQKDAGISIQSSEWKSRKVFPYALRNSEDVYLKYQSLQTDKQQHQKALHVKQSHLFTHTINKSI